MNLIKSLFSSFGNSINFFKSKEPLELLYLAYVSFGQVYSFPGILIFLLGLIGLLFTKTNSIAYSILFWFFNFNCLAFLRPSVDYKNFKYFLSYLPINMKLLSVFLLTFYLPYCILNANLLPPDSLTIAFFLISFGLLIPLNFSIFKIILASFLPFFLISIFIGFKSLIYHLLLMGYLNFEIFLSWLLYIFMFDKKLFDVFGISGFCMSPLIIFLILSVLDCRKSFYYMIKGFKKGLKLFFINYPIIYIWFHVFKFLVINIHSMFSLYGSFIYYGLVAMFIIFYYFYLSFFTNIYIKKVHEMF